LVIEEMGRVPALKADAEVDALFQLPLGEFTPARNALAKKLEKEGRRDEAARVKDLAKPPLSAWAVNQLYWRQRGSFERLMTAGDRLRSAQASQLRGKGGELGEPLAARSAALGELTRHVAAILAEAGHPSSPDLMRRITTTLEALAAYGSGASAPVAGRLTADVGAHGFGALAGLMPGKSGEARAPQEPRVLPFASPQERKAAREKLDPEERKRLEDAERKAKLAAAAAAVRAAEQSLAAARKDASRAESTLRQAAARAKDAQKQHDALAPRLEKAAAAAERARQEAHRIAAQAEEAAQAVADAERMLEDARGRYESLKY
jgi:hypothetical protein